MSWIENLTDEAILAEFAKIQVNNTDLQNEFGVVMISRQLKGRITSKQIQEAYANLYRTEWLETVALWKAGTLFAHQGYTFHAFMECLSSVRRNDEDKFLRMSYLASMTGEQESEVMKEVRLLHGIRIQPSIGSRREFFTNDGNLLPVREMTVAKRDLYTTWKQKYDEATSAHHWGGADE